MPDQNDFSRESLQLSREELIAIQELLGKACPAPWQISDGMNAVAGCFVCGTKKHEGKGAVGDPCWAAAAGPERCPPGTCQMLITQELALSGAGTNRPHR